MRETPAGWNGRYAGAIASWQRALVTSCYRRSPPPNRKGIARRPRNRQLPPAETLLARSMGGGKISQLAPALSLGEIGLSPAAPGLQPDRLARHTAPSSRTDSRN